jgi:hypothetical protein
MFEALTGAQRIEVAKGKMEKVLDHFLYLLELHENNAIVVYSPTLSSQIPTSYAANAFNVFQRCMRQFEIVRLCALWDRSECEKENIPTVIELIDDNSIIDTLAAETRSYWANIGTHHINPSSDTGLRAIEEEAVKESNIQFGNEQASKAKAGLRNAIANARTILASPRLAAVMNLRDKHLAHSLTATHREAKHGHVSAVKSGDETILLDASIPIIENLFCWVNGKSFSIADSQQIDRKNAEALWNGCTFKVLR